MIRTSYLDRIYYPDELSKLIKELSAKLLKFKKKNEFDAIAFTGTSGAAVAYPLSAALKIPLICVRKDKSHYFSKVEGAVYSNRYVIVDDFIESGKTMNRIVNEIKKNNKNADPVAIFLYYRSPVTKIANWNNIPVYYVK